MTATAAIKSITLYNGGKKLPKVTHYYREKFNVGLCLIPSFEDYRIIK